MSFSSEQPNMTPSTQESFRSTKKIRTFESYESSVSAYFLKRGVLVECIETFEKTQGPSPQNSLMGIIKVFIAASDHHYNSCQECIGILREENEQDYEKYKKAVNSANARNIDLVNMVARYKSELVSRDQEINSCRSVLEETANEAKRIFTSATYRATEIDKKRKRPVMPVVDENHEKISNHETTAPSVHQTASFSFQNSPSTMSMSVPEGFQFQRKTTTAPFKPFYNTVFQPPVPVQMTSAPVSAPVSLPVSTPSLDQVILSSNNSSSGPRIKLVPPRNTQNITQSGPASGSSSSSSPPSSVDLTSSPRLGEGSTGSQQKRKDSE